MIRARQRRKEEGRGRGRPRLSRLDPPEKHVNTAPFQTWGGWGDLFNCIVSLRDRSQLARHAADSTVDTFSQLQSRPRRIPMPGGRSRARRRV